MSFKARITTTSRPFILDGALGTLLPPESQSHALWSTHTVLSHPSIISDIHKSYITHGARIIQTSTYQTSEEAVEKWFPGKNYKDVVLKSVELADRARSESGVPGVFIAGSVGPFGASLANGAEYTGQYGDVDKVGIKKFHQVRLDVLCNDERVDLIALETIPNKDEIKTLIEEMNQKEKPYYLSLSVKEDNLADGASSDEIIKIVKEANDNLVAVGVNCLSLETSLKWLKTLKPLNRGLVVYPNSGELYVDRQWVRDSSKKQLTWEEYVVELKAIGDVRIVGGCCRTTPEIIGEIKTAVDKLF